MTDLNAKVEALREAVGKMSPGPWSAHDGQRTFRMPGSSEDKTVCQCGMINAEHFSVAWTVGADDEDHTLGEGVSVEEKALNAAGIVALRNDALPLITALQARIAEVERETVERCAKVCVRLDITEAALFARGNYNCCALTRNLAAAAIRALSERPS